MQFSKAVANLSTESKNSGDPQVEPCGTPKLFFFQNKNILLKHIASCMSEIIDASRFASFLFCNDLDFQIVFHD